jgi:hypothetical protein
MASSSSIDFDGMTHDIQHLGFSRGDAEREGVDNSLDAGATVVRVNRDTAKMAVSIADDGCGMDKEGCEKSLIFFSASAVSDKAGTFGIGGKAMHICLSAAAAPTTTFSKQVGGDCVQLTADWPKARRDGTWNPSASGVTVKDLPIWNSMSVNPDHGTVMYIPMPPNDFAAHMTTLQSDLADLAFSYEKELLAGKRIELCVDGVVQPLDMSLTLGWDNVQEVQRKETRIELWVRGDEERIYYWHLHLKPVYSEMVRSAEAPSIKKIRDYAQAAEDGFVLKAACVLRSVYNPAWDIEGQPPIPGYFALCRGTRSLCRLPPNIVGKGGDMRAQRVITSTRHSIEFTSAADKVFGVEVNKSHVREDAVHKGLLDMCRKLGKSWSNSYYENHLKGARAAVPPEGELALRIRRATAMLKRLAETHGDAYLDDFDNLTDDYNEAQNHLDE